MGQVRDDLVDNCDLMIFHAVWTIKYRGAHKSGNIFTGIPVLSSLVGLRSQVTTYNSQEVINTSDIRGFFWSRWYLNVIVLLVKYLDNVCFMGR